MESDQPLFTFEEDRRSPAKIMVVGIGGAGGNSVNQLVEAGIPGVGLVAVNTDILALRTSLAPLKFEIGRKLTGGLGCGGDPGLGRMAALEETERILGLLSGFDMVFIAGGEGGGTFTGAAPIFAGLASEVGALAIAIATMPFAFQAERCRACAETGIRELREAADAMIVIRNESLPHTLDENASMEASFRFANDILCQAVQGISEIVTQPGIMNLDLADVRTVMRHKGEVLMGTGVAEGQNRAAEAAQRAIANPLLEGTPIDRAKAALVNISGSRCSLRLHEAKSAAGVIKDRSGLDDLIIGATYDDSLEERLKVTVIATGLKFR